MVKNLPVMWETWVGKSPWRRERQPTPVFLPENSMDRGAWWAVVQGVAKELDTTEQLSYLATLRVKKKYIIRRNLVLKVI